MRNTGIKSYYANIERYDWVTEPRYLSKLYHHFRERETAKFIRKHSKGPVILDAGCGTGLITRHLDSEFTVGLDINRWAIERARVHSRGADFIVGDVENIPLKSESCDVVICTQVMEHLLKPGKMVQELFRILKPSGVLIGSVPSGNPVWRLRSYLSSRRSSLEPCHRNYTIAELKLLLNNFRIIDVAHRVCRMVVVFVAQKLK